MLLHNRISRIQLKKTFLKNSHKRIIVSFYKYHKLENVLQIRRQLYILLYSFKVLGRIYISEEGINAQISLPHYYYTVIKFFIKKIHEIFIDIYWNIAIDNTKHAFFMLKIIYKKNILNDGLSCFNFLKFNTTGIYLNAKQLNLMLEDHNNVVLVDIRNFYEYKIGHFINAIIFQQAKTFQHQMLYLLDNIQPYRDKKIILYCTGGIRCEKATSWLLFNNIKNVYQVEGGIIKYVKEVRKFHLPMKFIGTNFVFDNRMGEQITRDIISNCYQCKTPYNIFTNCKNDSCHLLFLQCPTCKKHYKNCCSIHCKKTLLKNKRYLII
ncbi:rhodanese-related sulfurtransferase [Enterobacteriaceae endosymbiont of Macroplea appendiculata]|uniref:oxygen-dependent tRNA uridine(34) hydroxylase TrhO n=1 Tax=Enterobacteriaceae endosymbiont of Macroplea appendiculata TaxID=2675790 RepID=UPI00144A0A1E|nr:rhodanese-related sulfurtransferase [Enterobacteriaceae endosymbiont of Macroplea appendiculata]QJC30779.1 rhodanese-related sulfurtransferase [Enterobacteriaceae endosymbiont of Macroplea appendiculata]